MKKIFTWCKELIMDRPLFWALGLLLVTPMLSFLIFFVLIQGRFPMHSSQDVHDLCWEYFPNTVFCRQDLIAYTMMWVVRMFFLGCIFVLFAILLFIEKKLSFKKISLIVWLLQIPFVLYFITFLALLFMKMFIPAQFIIYGKFLDKPEFRIGILVLFFLGLLLFFWGLVKYFLNRKESVAIARSMKLVFWGIITTSLVIPLLSGFNALLRIKMTPFSREILRIQHEYSLVLAALSFGLFLFLCGLFGLCVYLFRARGTDNSMIKETAKFVFLGAIGVIFMSTLWFGYDYLRPQLGRIAPTPAPCADCYGTPGYPAI